MPSTNPFQSWVTKKMTVPATKTATVTSDAIDVRNYDAAMFCVFYGANGGDTLSSTNKMTATLYECNTQSGTYTLVADDDVCSDVTGQTNSFALVDAAADDEAVYGLGYTGSQNYVKVKVTFDGTHTYGTPLCIYAILKLPATYTEENVANP